MRTSVIYFRDSTFCSVVRIDSPQFGSFRKVSVIIVVIKQTLVFVHGARRRFLCCSAFSWRMSFTCWFLQKRTSLEILYGVQHSMIFSRKYNDESTLYEQQGWPHKIASCSVAVSDRRRTQVTLALYERTAETTASAFARRGYDASPLQQGQGNDFVQLLKTSWSTVVKIARKVGENRRGSTFVGVESLKYPF